MTTPAGPDAARAPTALDGYALLAKLATGGMAEIFVARRLGGAAAGELVVIKRLLPHLAEDDEFATMFRDEAALASRLEHPNVCRVFHHGESAGVAFIAMEYLHGVALHRLLSRRARAGRPLPLRLVAQVLVQACAGLHHAHELCGPDGLPLQVVHRDVSPTNIFVGADGVVKLLDFGIAKARGASSRTRTGTVKGKHAYMSPEQILGRPLDRRSDVFALGAVAYELVTLHRVFHRDSDFLTFKAITEEPVPDVALRRADLPAAWRALLDRALAREREARTGSAQALAREVDAAVAPDGGPASTAELAALVREEFADELAAQLALTRAAAGAQLDADARSVPTTHGATSGRFPSVTPVQRPRRTGAVAALPEPAPPPDDRDDAAHDDPDRTRPGRRRPTRPVPAVAAAPSPGARLDPTPPAVLATDVIAGLGPRPPARGRWIAAAVVVAAVIAALARLLA